MKRAKELLSVWEESVEGVRLAILAEKEARAELVLALLPLAASGAFHVKVGDADVELTCTIKVSR